VYFRPSTIAGDNYVVDARVVWDQQRPALAPGRQAELTGAHGGRVLAGRTARIEVWRRVRLLRLVHWGRAAHDWNDTVVNMQTALQSAAVRYAAAYVKLDYRWPDVELEIQNADHGGFGVRANWGTLRAALAHAAHDDLLDLERPYAAIHGVGPTFDSARMLHESFAAVNAPPTPTFQQLLDRLVIEKLSQLLAVPRAAPGWTVEQQRTLEAIWLLVHSWENTPPAICGDAGLRGWVTAAGSAIAAGMRALLQRAGPVHGVATFHVGPAPAGPVPGFAFPVPNQIGQCTYNVVHVPAPDQYAPLVDALFVPHELRQELLAYKAAYDAAYPGPAPNNLPARMLGLVQRQILSAPWPTVTAEEAILESTRNDYNAVWSAPRTLSGPSPDCKTFNHDRPPSGFIPCARDLVAEEVERINTKVTAFCQPIFHWAGHQLDLAIRGSMHQTMTGGEYDDLADGVIVVHTLEHDPVMVSGRAHKVAGASFGDGMGVAYVSHHTTMSLVPLLVHEIAHTLFMQHFAIGDGGFPEDHDTDDRNCMMTYPYIWAGAAARPPAALSAAVERVLEVKRAFFRQRWRLPGGLWGQFTNNQFALVHDPVFCGKCNLKLRGWNIHHAALRGSTTGRPLPNRAPF
jgi:hypothetical protein